VCYFIAVGRIGDRLVARGIASGGGLPEDGSQTEYFWLGDLERHSGKVSGTVNNTPELVKNVKEGDRISVMEGEIADWMFMRDGKMHGNFTLRPLFKTMSPDEAAKLRAVLAEP
jgi:uncharacterized protein YegJ (DUF2314 family)